MKHDPDHYLTQPMDNQEAAHNRRVAVTEENVAACAQAIRALDKECQRLRSALETEQRENRKLQYGATIYDFERLAVEQDSRLREVLTPNVQGEPRSQQKNT